MTYSALARRLLISEATDPLRFRRAGATRSVVLHAKTP